MKCFTPTSASWAFGLLLAAELIPSVAAAPKAPWVREHMNSRGRKVLNRALSNANVKRQSNQTEPAECEIQVAEDVDAPKDNIWGGLTTQEAVDVTAWLFARADLNLTTTEEAGAWDNTLILVELNPPNKTEALAYIDGDGDAPTRYAHAVINHSADEEPYYQDIIIGPLPVVNGTTSWEPLEYPLTRKTDARVRNLDADIYEQVGPWTNSLGAAVADITRDMWNATAMGLDNDTLGIWGIDPTYQDDGRIRRWDGFFTLPTDLFDTITLLPTGLYVMSDVTGRDTSQWTVEGWYYNGVFYETTEEFRDAYWAGDIEVLEPVWDNEYFHTDQRGTPQPQDSAAPPVSVAPQGNRFSVDVDRKYVEWMGWSFYIGFTRDTGMALHDIKLNGTRILYELGLQEAVAHYAGSDPVQSHVAYLDSYYGFGPFHFELLKGYDCPSYGTFLNTSFYAAENTQIHLNSICLYESEADYLMMRHSTASYVAASKNIFFNVRSVATIGNYDYMFTYTFYMDGSLGVEVRASGYIQATYYAHNEEYGYRIHDQLSGSMHDHVLNFKADFDILGTNNSVELTDVVPVSTTYPWSQGKVFNTMKLERSFVETEDDGRFNWAHNGQQQVHVVNQDERNQYGELRGYRVSPSGGTAHLTVQNSTALGNTARWAEHDIMISQRKDTEPRSAHAYANQDTANPPIDFDAFFDGESLNQTDLVLWLNLGMHHVPHTGDLPNTVFTTAHSGIVFTPVNYFDSALNIETVNMVRIAYNANETTEVLTFGSDNSTCGLDYEPAHVDLWDYRGDVVVRKFPFDAADYYKAHN